LFCKKKPRRKKLFWAFHFSIFQTEATTFAKKSTAPTLGKATLAIGMLNLAIVLLTGAMGLYIAAMGMRHLAIGIGSAAIGINAGNYGK